MLGVKCIESEDGKNYTFGYRSNCQILLKRLTF